VKHGGSYIVVILFTAELQGNMYTGRLGNQVHPMIQTLFMNCDALFQDEISCHFTQLKMFTHGLKSMKVNFNIFPGQQSQQF
jgi:hypothetical protein